MSPAILLFLALGLGLAGWLAARARAWAFRRDSAERRLPSLPVYHAWYVALWIILPMVAFIALWSAIAPGLVTQQVLASPAAAELPAFGFQRQTILNEARAVATGAASAVFNPQAAALVEPYREALFYYNTIGIIVSLLVAFLAGLAAAIFNLSALGLDGVLLLCVLGPFTSFHLSMAMKNETTIEAWIYWNGTDDTQWHGREAVPRASSGSAH